MRTILNKAQQTAWLDEHWRHHSIAHRWNCRGMGFSRITDARGDTIATASGRGYDRRGQALGDAVTAMFPAEVLQLARRHCRGRRRNRKDCQHALYGLFYDAVTDSAHIDGGCGQRQVENILALIGFELISAGGDSGQRTVGTEYWTLQPVRRDTLRWLKEA